MVTVEERETIDTIWDVLDEEKNGTLDKGNLKQFFIKLGKVVEDKTLDEIFANANLN